MDYSKLRGRIREKFHTEKAFAEAFGCSAGAMSMKLNNKTNWTQDGIFRACQLLDIPDNQVNEYFFTLKVL